MPINNNNIDNFNSTNDVVKNDPKDYQNEEKNDEILSHNNRDNQFKEIDNFILNRCNDQDDSILNKSESYDDNAKDARTEKNHHAEDNEFTNRFSTLHDQFKHSESRKL